MEAVFIAANVAEAELVEALLEEEGIEYELRPEACAGSLSGTCLQGLMFEVPDGQAEDCRRLLAERGLNRGVL